MKIAISEKDYDKIVAEYNRLFAQQGRIVSLYNREVALLEKTPHNLRLERWRGRNEILKLLRAAIDVEDVSQGEKK